MLSATPRAHESVPFDLPGDPPAPLEAPEYLVQRYVELTAKRRALDEQIAVLRAELEILAVSSLTDERPRGRFAARSGHVSARLQPTCLFDKAEVARQLQRAGRLADVAQISGPSLARFLAAEPVLAGRLGDAVRYRKSVVLMASNGP